jgi:hypothetical protein
LFLDPQRKRLGDCSLDLDSKHERPAVDYHERGDTTVLTLDGVEVTEGALITELLDRFTDKLTEIECASF